MLLTTAIADATATAVRRLKASVPSAFGTVGGQLAASQVVLGTEAGEVSLDFVDVATGAAAMLITAASRITWGFTKQHLSTLLLYARVILRGVVRSTAVCGAARRRALELKKSALGIVRFEPSKSGLRHDHWRNRRQPPS